MGGTNDYFSEKAHETLTEASGNVETEYLQCVPNQWNDRLRFEVTAADYGMKFWESKLFKAYCRYWTQCGFRFFFRAANADAVYWYRNTHNLMIGNVKVQASSGEHKYINDFCLGNVEMVNDAEGIGIFADSAWVPEENDTDKKVCVEWAKPVTVKTLKLYQNFKEIGHINQLEIEFSNGHRELVDCISDDVQYIKLPLMENITSMNLRIVSTRGRAGIRELEVYEDSGEFPWEDVPMKPFDESSLKIRKHIKFYENIAKIYWTVFRGINKIKQYLGFAAW
jgi:hypothetical protein